jgi:hypothetical protein
LGGIKGSAAHVEAQELLLMTHEDSKDMQRQKGARAHAEGREGARMEKGRTSRREPLARAQGRWKLVRQERMWQPSVAPFRPHARHLIMRPRRTQSATASSRPAALSYT